MKNNKKRYMFSFVLNDEKENEKYQLIVPKNWENADEFIPINIILDEKFLLFFSYCAPSEITHLINYHFDKCMGYQDDFLNHLEYIIGTYGDPNNKEGAIKSSDFYESQGIRIRTKIALDCIKNLRDKTTNLMAEKFVKCKIPAQKSILTSGQISILVEYMKKYEIITQPENTAISVLFERLTGISDNSIRVDLSYISKIHKDDSRCKRYKGDKPNDDLGNLRKISDIMDRIIKDINSEISENCKKVH